MGDVIYDTLCEQYDGRLQVLIGAVSETVLCQTTVFQQTNLICRRSHGAATRCTLTFLATMHSKSAENSYFAAVVDVTC